MEQFKESFHIAITNLGHNAVRSILSILGVVIGIAAVITVLSIGAGANKQILEKMNSLGGQVLTVSTRYDENTQRIGELSMEDVERLSLIPSVISVTPTLNLYRPVRSRNVETRGVINGVDASYLSAKSLPLLKGRNLSPLEVESRATLCLLSREAERVLFPGEETSIGQSVYIDELPWDVIGVYSTEAGSKENLNKDIELLVPLTTLIRNSKDISLSRLEVQTKPGIEVSALKNELISALERDDPKRKGLFSVRDQKEYVQRSLEIQNSLSLIGVLVACVSLVVGGIGMMNVMLTSVAERTREIGIRRAVGARRKDILFQFLVESCVLSLLGGVLGLLFGAALAKGLPLMFKEYFNVLPLIKPSFLLLSVSTGVVLGVVFGFYPAVKASHLSPSEALRTE